MLSVARAQGGDRESFDRWCADAVSRARAGDRAAFDELVSAHQRVVYGFIRVRVADDEEARDLAQDAWLLIWQKLSTYDADRAPFHSFARYWASVVVLRHFDALREERRCTCVSELVRRHPNLAAEDDGDMASVLDRLQHSLDPVSMAPATYEHLYSELLRATFASASPPHQLIAFGFTKASGLPPRAIAASLSDVPLRDLALRLEKSYLNASQLDERLVGPSFAPLHAVMDRPFSRVVDDPKTLATYPHLHNRLVGDTTLRDFYTGDDPAADITRWWYAVQRRVRVDVQRRGQGPLFELLRTAQRRAVRESARDPAATGDRGHA